MAYELLIFDCDGVLIDSEGLANQVEIEALKELGYVFSIEDYLDIALGRPTDEMAKLFATDYGMQLPEDFWQKVRKRQEEEFRAKLMPIVGVKEVIEALQIPCCVASGSGAERLKLTLTITGLFPLLEGRIFGKECVKRGKPEPDIFLYAANQMGVAPAKCLVIEDSIHGVKAAQTAGMQVWAFCGASHFTPKRKEQLFQSRPDQFFDQMQEIGSLLIDDGICIFT